MKNIGGFFEKFNNKIAKEVNNLVFIISAIEKHTGITFDMKDISIKSGVLRVKASSVQKNEIFMKKTKILGEVNGKLQSMIIRDIQ